MMTSFTGLKRWWSNNPVMACGLGSLALIAFLFFFPFGAVFAGLGWLLEALFSWVPDAFAGWLNFVDENTKIYFAVSGFFLVFFLCLGSKKANSKAIEAFLFASAGVLFLSAIFWAVGVSSSSNYSTITPYIDSLDGSSLFLSNAADTADVCGVRGSGVVKTEGLPSSGRKVFVCEVNEAGRTQVVERSLSEVDWMKQACRAIRCRGAEWKAYYSESKKGIVFETSTGVIRSCKYVLSSLPGSTRVTLNGKPADPAQCGYGANTIQAVYSPSWLKE